MSLNPSKVEKTVTIPVNVQFRQQSGAMYQGQFKATLNRLPQSRIDEMMDAEPPMLNSEIVDEVLVGVSGIGASESEQMPQDEAMAWVKDTPECVNAIVKAFFKESAPDDSGSRTSRRKSRRS